MVISLASGSKLPASVGCDLVLAHPSVAASILLRCYKKSSKQAGLLDFSFLLICPKSAQGHRKDSSLFRKDKAIFGILAYSNR